MTKRRFPPPWSVEDIGAAFVVRDHSGQQLAYVYFEDEPGRRSAAFLLKRDLDPAVNDNAPRRSLNMRVNHRERLFALIFDVEADRRKGR